MAILRRGQGKTGRRRARTAIPPAILARMPPAGEPPPRPSPAAPAASGALLDQARVALARAQAASCGLPVHEVLLAEGALSHARYAAALAADLGVPLLSWEATLDLSDAHHAPVGEIGLPARLDGRLCRILDAAGAPPDVLRAQVAELREAGVEPVLAPRPVLDAALACELQDERLDRAVNGLLRERPASSAGAPHPPWQSAVGVAGVGALAGGYVVAPDAIAAFLTVAIAVPFLCVTLLRAYALRQALASPRRKAHRAPPAARLCPDRLLPTYSVLVPVVREADVLAGLMAALSALDYPAAKLEVLLVLEADDIDTQAALLELALPGNFRTVLVPPGEPRTKPKALNYALQLARGHFVVVYDAEDRPEPMQLRHAWEVFRRAPPGLGCLQAQLNIYNARESWLTGQFAIEYSALFDAILPALERLALPVPLGGTSNHFPRAVLDEVGAWDPFNVTEDADLGIRLARHGYHTGVLASTTWEEAPPAFGPWLRQRTRWLKGWMQTYLVHTRELWRLNRELGLAAAIGFHALMGGLVVSALVHPVFYAVLAGHWWSGELLAPAQTTAGAVLWAIAFVNLCAGYLASILVGMLSVSRRGHPRLALHALAMPLYWLLISLAAYRALYQLARAPYLWEKTAHGPAARRAGRGGGRLGLRARRPRPSRPEHRPLTAG